MGQGGRKFQPQEMEWLGARNQPPEGGSDPATQGTGYPETDRTNLALPETFDQSPGCLFSGQGGRPPGAAETQRAGRNPEKNLSPGGNKGDKKIVRGGTKVEVHG